MLTGTPIVVGDIITLTGPLAGDVSLQAQTGAKAWEGYVDSHGGINGHPVRVVIIDDGGQAAAAPQAAQTLIDSDHIVALIDPATGTNSWQTVIKQNNVPLITNIGGSPTASWFVAGSGPLVAANALAGSVKRIGLSSAGLVVCAESPSCASAEPLVQRAAQSAGVAWAGSAEISASAPSYTADCLSFKQKNSSALLLAIVAPTLVRLAQACAQQGFKPVYVGLPSLVDHTTAGQSVLDGLVIVNQVFPWFLSDTPQEQEFHQALKAQVPNLSDTSPEYGPETASAWVSFKLFQQAAEQATQGGAPLTSDSLVAGIKSLPDPTLGGLQGKTDYTKPYYTQGSCYFLTRLSGGKWTVPYGSGPQCPVSGS